MEAVDVEAQSVAPNPADKWAFTSFCFKINSLFAVFVIQVVITMAILAFCITQIACGVSSTEQTVYFSMIASIVSIWMPSPLAVMTGSPQVPPVT